MDFKSIYLANRNPSIAPEDWPRAWRSHPRAVSQMASVGAGIAATIDTINYCARVRAPLLDGAPFEPPEASTAYDGVAVVSSAREDLHRVGRNREGQEAVVADEVRVFGRPAHEFSFACREVMTLGGPPGQAAVIHLLMRRPGSTREDFLARLTGRHAELARAAFAGGKMVRYVQNAVVVEPPPGYEFDGVSEAWFANVEDAVRSFVDPSLAPLSRDLPDFCDMDRSVTMLTEVIFRLPRNLEA